MIRVLALLACLLPGVAFAQPSGGGTTIRDGGDVTQGAKADSVCGTATGTCTSQQLMKFIASSVSGPVPAGSATIGNVGLVSGAATVGNVGLVAGAATVGNVGLVAGSATVGAVSQANGDPCSSVTHVFTPINIVTGANTKIVTGTSAKKTYVCHLFLFAAAADNVGIVEGSGTNCGTSALGVIGGNTAATGINLAANQGFESGQGSNAIAATTVNANDLCLITSASVQLSGVAVTVQQ